MAEAQRKPDDPDNAVNNDPNLAKSGPRPILPAVAQMQKVISLWAQAGSMIQTSEATSPSEPLRRVRIESSDGVAEIVHFSVIFQFPNNHLREDDILQTLYQVATSKAMAIGLIISGDMIIVEIHGWVTPEIEAQLITWQAEMTAWLATL